jgi:hypothetical protein
MRLRVSQANHVTNSQLLSCNLVDRHDRQGRSAKPVIRIAVTLGDRSPPDSAAETVISSRYHTHETRSDGHASSPTTHAKNSSVRSGCRSSSLAVRTDSSSARGRPGGDARARAAADACAYIQAQPPAPSGAGLRSGPVVVVAEEGAGIQFIATALRCQQRVRVLGCGQRGQTARAWPVREDSDRTQRLSLYRVAG